MESMRGEEKGNNASVEERKGNNGSVEERKVREDSAYPYEGRASL